MYLSIEHNWIKGKYGNRLHRIRGRDHWSEFVRPGVVTIPSTPWAEENCNSYKETKPAFDKAVVAKHGYRTVAGARRDHWCRSIWMGADRLRFV